MDFFSLTGKLMSKSTTGVETYLRAILAEEHRKTRKKRIEEPTLRYAEYLESTCAIALQFGSAKGVIKAMYASRLHLVASRAVTLQCQM